VKKGRQDFDGDTSEGVILKDLDVDGCIVFHWMVNEGAGREWNVLTG
jgi:hypothetical protein